MIVRKLDGTGSHSDWHLNLDIEADNFYVLCARTFCGLVVHFVLMFIGVMQIVCKVKTKNVVQLIKICLNEGHSKEPESVPLIWTVVL